MSKAVLISIKPEWCEKIATEEKTIEVRKTRPKIDAPFKCLIYCTKGANLWIADLSGYYHLGNGRVIGEFVCDEIYPIWVFESGSIQARNRFKLHRSCLSSDEMANYIGRNKTGYGWHISNLKIYDKPKELSEFYKPCPNDAPCSCCKHAFIPDDETPALIDCNNTLKRPPQSWCYVEKTDDTD